MSYSKTNWQNGVTPINATNLNKIEEELEYLDTSEDFASKVTFNENYGSISFKKTGNLVSISYQGESKAHAVNDLIFTLPEGYRPKTTIYIPIIINTIAYGIVDITTSGTCNIRQLTQATSGGRVFFNVTFPCD